MSSADALLVEVEGEVDAVDESVADALLVAGLGAVGVVRVAMLIVVFRDIGIPVAALTVAGAIGMVVEAVPLAETVLLMYALGIAADIDMAIASAPCTWNGLK